MIYRAQLEKERAARTEDAELSRRGGPNLQHSDSNVADESFQNTHGSVIGLAGNAAGLADHQGAGSAWEQDRPDCGACGIKFSTTNRAHHCRLCGHCVCHACSPSSVTLDSWKGTQRVCSHCIAMAPRAQSIRERVLEVGRQLHDVHSEIPEVYGDSSTTLADAVQFCEREMLPLKAGHAHAAQTLLQMCDGLAELAGKEKTAPVRGGLEEAVGFIEALVEPVATRLSEAEATLEKERAVRVELEAKLARLTSDIAIASAAASMSLRASRDVPTGEGESASARHDESGPLYQLAGRSAAKETKKGRCIIQ